MSPPADLNSMITTVLKTAPQWIRADLNSKDPAIRERAEEALAAMVSAAVAEAREVTFREARRH